jgi:hypothetical protein
LLETLVAAGLLLAFFMVVGQILIPCIHMTIDNAVKTGLQQTAMSSLERFESDVRLSDSQAISLHVPVNSADVSVAALDRVQPQTFSGAMQMEASVFVYMYRPSAANWVRWNYTPPGNPVLPILLSDANLVALGTSVVAGQQMLASKLTSFSLIRSPSGAYQVTMQLSDTLSNGQPTTYQSSRTIYPRV